jgi:DNA-binding GntR family transcriptional regulator
VGKAAETAYAVIRTRILSGDFSRGERLREEELAQLAGVSRTPIREALRRLDAEGLVEFLPNRGASVTAWTEQELDSLYEARALMEGYAAGQAAKRISEEALDRLAELSRQMWELDTGSGSADEMTRLNNEFHRIIAAASGNSHLESQVRGLTDAVLVYRTFRHYTPERLMASKFYHDEIVAALRARDGAWASAIIRAHILAARPTIQSLVRGVSESVPGPAAPGDTQIPQDHQTSQDARKPQDHQNGSPAPQDPPPHPPGHYHGGH